MISSVVVFFAVAKLFSFFYWHWSSYGWKDQHLCNG